MVFQHGEGPSPQYTFCYYVPITSITTHVPSSPVMPFGRPRLRRWLVAVIGGVMLLGAAISRGHAQSPPGETRQAIMSGVPNIGRADASSDAQLLAALRALRFTAKVPPLTGFHPAHPVALAPPTDAGDYRAAYADTTGCMTYFLPLSNTVTAVEMQWSGPPCQGKLLQGEGQLRVKRQIRGPFETFSGVNVFEGRFENGVLTGPGKKSNFIFNEAGRLQPGVFVLEGEFAHGLLHGQGVLRWSGAANQEPGAWVKEGKFTQGVPTGLIRLSRLNPYQNVEADSGDVVYDTHGEEVVEQAQANHGVPVAGRMFFYKDPVGWKTETAVWQQQPESAVLTRIDPVTGHTFRAECRSWEVRTARWSCDRGAAALTTASGRRLLGVDGGAFSIPIPFDTSDTPLRLAGPPPERRTTAGDASPRPASIAGVQHGPLAPPRSN